MNRRQFVHRGASSFAAGWIATRWPDASPLRERPVPSAAQLQWQRDELAMFLHFGVNTFTDREWGDGREDPALFNPAALDARQWARTAHASGFRSMILTAKHHDGFCLWPTRTTAHSVAASPWRSGSGDVVREMVDACRAEGMRPGLYLSPWDRNNPVYGDSPRYNDLYCDQLTELLTQYGPLAEVWFDGANDPNWSTVDPLAVPYPGANGPGVNASLQHGDPMGPVWRPAEMDVSIRPGWFYHEGDDAKVRTVENLVDLYASSVGRNGKLLLNVPPTRDGVLHATDVERLRGFRERLDAVTRTGFGHGARAHWTITGARTARLDVTLARAEHVSMVRLAEDIARGQSVARYTLEASNGGAWSEIASGTTIGHAKIDRFQPTMVRRLRLRIEDSVATPHRVSLTV